MYHVNNVSRASAQLAAGDTVGAMNTLDAAARAGDASAVFTQALWLLANGPVGRDVPRALTTLRRCVEMGHVDAALVEISLTANGSVGAPDWPNALALLRTAAEKDPVAADHLRLIERMALDANGDPTVLPKLETLSKSPDVQIARNFLTESECEHLALNAQATLEPAVVIDPQSGRTVPHPVRTAHGTVYGPTRETLAIYAINKRIAAISRTNVNQGEPLAILHYSVGQRYRPHLDTVAGTVNQRLKTVLVYLNQGYGGGETFFTANSLRIVPKAGDAIIFANVLPDGGIDQRAQHAGLPVTRGAKWLATRWIRAKRYDPWNPPRP